MEVLRNLVLNIYYVETNAFTPARREKYRYFKPEIEYIYIKYPNRKGDYVYRWFKMVPLKIPRDEFDNFIKNTQLWQLIGPKTSFYRGNPKKTMKSTLELNPKLLT